MRKIFNFFVLLAAVAVILLTVNFIYLYAQDKEADSIVYQVASEFVNKLNSL